ncbi:6-pyruvoyl-tetrahydropterin synthase [Clostridium sp. CAG:448]|nr:6-pyruvoyl-tetrahydropterin synthase [Clostridium sp. CAG:448]
MIRIGVSGHLTVQKVDNTRRILFRKHRIVRDHDNQFVLGNALENFHDLHAGFGVKRAGRLIRKQNIRVIDQGTRDRDTLHLSAGHLIGAFVKLVAQSDALQCLFCAAAPFRFGNTGQGQRKLHIGEHTLVGNQVIALKNKAD